MQTGSGVDGTAKVPAQSKWPVGGSGAGRLQASSKARILAVDDASDALTILRLFLTAHGFEVITAGGVDEALRHLKERRPDLIITDYNMPEATGLDLCRWVRSQPQTRDIPLILHTGSQLPHAQTDLFDAVCEKPSSLAQLLCTVRGLLATSQAARASQSVDQRPAVAYRRYRAEETARF